MTGPTHVAIAISCGMLAGAEGLSIAFLAAGALLPDMDTPRSIIGRIFLPLSIPLERWLGHRGAFHSFWLWALVSLIGMLYEPLKMVGIGAFIHVVSDCMTVSGVRAMTPFSQKLFVLFQRSWRFKTGGNAEIGILLVAGTLAWTGYQIGTLGGLGATLGYILKAPKIMVEEYRKVGLTKCKIEGKFRWNSGKTIEGTWQVIGLKSGKVFFIIGDKIIKDGEQGELLKARLIKSEEHWDAVKLSGWGITKKKSFFFTGGKWFVAMPGDFTYGSIIGDDLEVITAPENLYDSAIRFDNNDNQR